MFGFSKKTGPALGLDVNSQSISLIQLDKSKRGLEVVGFASMPCAPNSIREGLIVEPDTIGHQVGDLIESLGSKTPKSRFTLNVAVPGQSVIIRLLPVPTGMPADELADVVRQEAINHVPFPLEEANLDWAVMPATERVEADGVARVDVILAAMQKSVVDTYWRVAETAGIRLGTISVSSLAFLRSLSLAGYFEQDDKLTMAINLRQEGTDISIVKNGMPLFSRSVVLGVDTLLEAISRSLDISVEEASQLVPQAPLLGVTISDQKLSQVAQIARTVLGDITDEVGRSLDFYRSQVAEVNLNQVILSGVGSEVPGVDRFFQNRLNIDTATSDPFREFIDSTPLMEARKFSCATAMGAACDPAWLPIASVDVDLNREGPSGAVFEGGEAMPAIPVDTPWFTPVLGVGIICVVVISAVWLYFSQWDIPRKEAELTHLQTEIDDQQRQAKKLPKLTEERDTLLRKKNVLESIIKRGSPWAELLESVSASTPEGLQIKKLDLTPMKLNIVGSTTDFSKISHFAINLNGTNVTSEANINSASREQTDPRVIDFAISAPINQKTMGLNSSQPDSGEQKPQKPSKQASLPVSN